MSDEESTTENNETMLDIIDMGDGRFALCPAGQPEAPFIELEFSESSLDFLQGEDLNAAKEMFKAAIEFSARLNQQRALIEEISEDDFTIH